MAGGVGVRFWPWSRRQRPKQLLTLGGRHSMLAETALRVRGMAPDANILVVTGQSLRGAVAEAVPWLSPQSILCEPVGRNTAPCVGWAAHEILARDPDGVMAVLPADHCVSPRSAFRSAMMAAFSIADSQRKLLTFGVVPDGPATGYGYIKAGSLIDRAGGVREVAGFREKPSLAIARRLVSDGKHFWNAGIFVWRADLILEELARFQPGIAARLNIMAASRRRGRIPAAAVDKAYRRMRGISIDYGVLEKSDRMAVIPAQFQWSDVGSWDAMAGQWPADGQGNHSRGRVVAVQASGNIVAAEGKTVALVGVDDLVVVDSEDAILIVRRDKCQDVREVVDALRRRRREDLL